MMESGDPERRFPTLFQVAGSLGWPAHEDTGGNKVNQGGTHRLKGCFAPKRLTGSAQPVRETRI
jgi:hypothetical protein